MSSPKLWRMCRVSQHCALPRRVAIFLGPVALEIMKFWPVVRGKRVRYCTVR